MRLNDLPRRMAPMNEPWTVHLNEKWTLLLQRLSSSRPFPHKTVSLLDVRMLGNKLEVQTKLRAFGDLQETWWGWEFLQRSRQTTNNNEYINLVEQQLCLGVGVGNKSINLLQHYVLIPKLYEEAQIHHLIHDISIT